MAAKKSALERPRIDVSARAAVIIDDLLERGQFDSVREIIDAALPLLQIKLVNDSQLFADQYEDADSMKEMTELQLKESPV